MTIENITETLISQYKKLPCSQQPLIVGVDGFGGAGKTTFAHRLTMKLNRKGLNVIILHIDDFIVESDKRYGTGQESWYEYYFLQWDIKFLQTELLQKLHRAGNVICLPVYDKKADTVSKREIYIHAQSIVLMEGVFIQRQEWRDHFDFVIFLDCCKEERKKRVLNRDLYIGDIEMRLAKYETRYWKAEDYYIKRERPLDKANIILRQMSSNHAQGKITSE